MGSNSSQTPAELSEEDIEFISSKAKIDHDSVKVWYEKLKVSLVAWKSWRCSLLRLIPGRLSER